VCSEGKLTQKKHHPSKKKKKGGGKEKRIEISKNRCKVIEKSREKKTGKYTKQQTESIQKRKVPEAAQELKTIRSIRNSVVENEDEYLMYCTDGGGSNRVKDETILLEESNDERKKSTKDGPAKSDLRRLFLHADQRGRDREGKAIIGTMSREEERGK